LLPREGYFITPIIADLNILIFVAMVFAGLGFLSFDAPDLLAWGADYKPSVAGGQWWRLITSIFLHGGLIHVFANTFGLVFAGLFLEPKLGRVKFAGVYLAVGVLASLTSLWWHNATVSVGASGAIFGLYGTLLALILTKVYPRDFGKAFLPSILIFIGYNLLMGLRGSVDNAAHLGGLVSGFVIGLLLSQRMRTEVNEITPAPLENPSNGSV
jgi:membrane associated rhomboid family serine protease